jgi:GNAT superfamily N-acetyltransferase
MEKLTLDFIVRDLAERDLPSAEWAGSGVLDGFERMQRGEVDYLVVCPPSGVPVGTGAVSWTENAGAGTLYQLHIHEIMRSCGLGTLLIHEAENRIRSRGLDRAELGIDAKDPRPRPLYERLGYEAYGEEPGGWDETLPDGSTRRYETTIILMRKAFGMSRADPGATVRS